MGTFAVTRGRLPLLRLASVAIAGPLPLPGDVCRYPGTFAVTGDVCRYRGRLPLQRELISYL